MNAQFPEHMQQCLQDCLQCSQTCEGEATPHCLDAGGRHAEPTDLDLMLNCAEICRTATDLLFDELGAARSSVRCLR